MKSVGRICVYCSRPLGSEDRVAVCDRCYAAHHEECWERNGRCSTFRCAGLPRSMAGADLPAVLMSAFKKANEQPEHCPFCGGTAYAGTLQGHRGDQTAKNGLTFVSGESGGAKIFRRKKSWWLPGAHLNARSCGRCKRLFLWGVPIDEVFLQKAREREGERFCPHCGEELKRGQITIHPRGEGGARFECEDIPKIHKDWFGHNVLDRLFHCKWSPPIESLPAESCEQCQYTEVAGRPIYRFL